ncbi:putative salt tolerance-like protein [Morus notabilis]|uniref:Putative salt tolerance-like protein n=1 Tax=Morus notabilis TaxID=981085 RepID=W9R1K3_9ROSA|nr:putative salt tolerance-like protein [Morus notabilis]
MKIQCNVCEAAEANVLCCADEAALCWACDEKVHAANKLASKHQRVPLSTSSSNMPKCDICQVLKGGIRPRGVLPFTRRGETVGYFFCLEDRALLCRKCDLAIHTANTFVSGHQRFLLTGVKVGLEPTEPIASTSSGKSLSGEKRSEIKSHPVSKRETPTPSVGDCKVSSVNVGGGGQDFAAPKVSFTGGSAAGSILQWQIDDYIALSDYNHSFEYMDNGSSKADSGKLGDSDDSVFRASEEELDNDECLGKVPETSWAVPQKTSAKSAHTKAPINLGQESSQNISKELEKP